jgi:hypothetical protein
MGGRDQKLSPLGFDQGKRLSRRERDSFHQRQAGSGFFPSARTIREWLDQSA